jgi:hypothetical protein
MKKLYIKLVGGVWWLSEMHALLLSLLFCSDIFVFVESAQSCLGYANVVDSWNCTIGEYLPTGYATARVIQNVKEKCSTCFQPQLGTMSVVGRPTNSYYTGPSPAISFDKCPWKCNAGLRPALGFCYPGADCNDPFQQQQLYSTVRTCVSNSPCPAGFTPVPPTASILTAHADRFAGLLIHNLATSTISGVVGAQCFTEQSSNLMREAAYSGMVSDGGNLDGNFSTASFGNPLIAQQSGGSDLTAVFDTKYFVLKTINRTSQKVETVAGGGGGYSIDGIGTSSSFSSRNQQYFFPVNLHPKRVVDFQLAVNHNATAALIWEYGLMRYVNFSTKEMSTIAGQAGVTGYAEGNKSEVLYSAVSGISLSPDASFALVIDNSQTVRYLNISTGQSSFLAGKVDKVSSIDGVGSNALFYYPSSIAISNDGKFALVGDCGDPALDSSGIKLGYPSIRHVNISTGAVKTIGGRWNRRGHIDSDVYFGGSMMASNPHMWCPTAITIAEDDSYAVFLDYANYALRTIDLVNFKITTLDKLASAFDTPKNNSFPTSISNILGSGNAKMSVECQTCPAGSYNIPNGCELCPPGTFSARGATGCTTCTAGKSSFSSGSSECLTCSAGTYSILSSCSPCPPGTLSAAGASQCTPCAAGTYDISTSGGSTQCQSCSPGTYNTGLGNMVGVPSTSVWSGPDTNRSTVGPLTVWPGTYCSRLYAVEEQYQIKTTDPNSFVQLACNNVRCPWPEGPFCRRLAVITPTEEYWICAAGCDQTKRCLDLNNAFYTGPGTTTADSCPVQCNPGFNNMVKVPSVGISCSVQPPCALCAEGKFSLLGATVCSECTACPDGKYNPGCTASSGGSCLECPACNNGFYPAGCGGSNPGECAMCTNT